MQATNDTVSVSFKEHPDRVRYLALCGCFAVLIGVYWGTFVSLVNIWLKSDTFAHGILIGPIALYLIYERRASLARSPKRASWLGLVGIAGAGACWWVAFVADVQVAQQLAVVGMIPCLVLAILGSRAAWEIAFPLSFLFLAVPFGEAMTPQLIDLTADFVVSALRWSGIPVFREGTHFVIPSSRWSVVSGCSGMRYLMATITVASLFAYLNYVSNVRRVVFIVGAILASIVANWLRAYGIVMIAHFSGMKLALGIDHYIYGWVFFGIIIFGLMAVGRLWQEDPPEQDAMDGRQPSAQERPTEPASRLRTVGGLGIVLLIVWPVLASYTLSNSQASGLVPQFPQSVLPPGWTSSDAAMSDWVPTFHGETKLLQKTFEVGTNPVGLFVAWYGEQHQGAEIVNAKNVLIWEKHERWTQRRMGIRDIEGVEGINSVIENEMAAAGRKFLVWQWYWIGGRTATAAHIAKLQQLTSQLSGKGSAGASVLIYTTVLDDDYAEARQHLKSFMKTFQPSLQQSLNDAIER